MVVETVSKVFIKRNGILDMSHAYDKVGKPINGHYPVYSGTRMGFIQEDGKIFIPMVFDSDCRIQSNGNYLCISMNKKYGIIDMKFVVTLVDFIYDSIDMEKLSEGMLPVEKGSKWGFVSLRNSHFMINPQFEAVGSYKNGYAPAKQNGLWGIINTKGKWVVQPLSLIETTFEDDYAIIFKGTALVYDKRDCSMSIRCPNCMLVDRHGHVFETGHDWIYRSGPNTFVFQSGVNSNNAVLDLPSKRFVSLCDKYHGYTLVIENGHYLNGWINTITSEFKRLIPSVLDQNYKYYTHAALLNDTSDVIFYVIDEWGQKVPIKHRELKSIVNKVWDNLVAKV